MKRIYPATIIILTALFSLQAQETGVVFGYIQDSLKNPVELANVALLGTSEGTMTNHTGYFELVVPANKSYTLVISCIGYKTESIGVKVNPLERYRQDLILKTDITNLREVSVSTRQERASTFRRIDIEDLNYMPSATGKVETIIKSQAGVSSNNELSSQYSVRGGNFDENLVYVNDIEIYRPFLVRSGQQEGLSFINSDLVSSIKFSAGGFDARYDDKMSSALDITYKRPNSFGGSVSISLLGASAHLEGASKDKRFRYLGGYRYKTTSYLLNTLETSGDYKPQFADLQMMLTYELSSRVEISFLGNYSSNAYQFVPSTRLTEFGTKDIPLNLNIYYDGQELDNYETFLGALTLLYKPTRNLSFKFISTAFRTSEEETYDISGQYWINELDNTIGSKTYGDSILNVGVGTLLSHARNYLDAIVLSGNIIGTYRTPNNTLKWGAKYQYQIFADRIREWEMIDSSGYSIPLTKTENTLELSRYRQGQNELAYDQYSGFIQNTYEWNRKLSDFFFTAGARGSYWNFNGNLMFSPRITLSMQPGWERDMMFHISGGYYYQPPFYKELRLPNDSINYEIRPQRSIHFLIGGDYIFSMWDRPFKISAEIYNKWLSDIIPYKIENVRIDYAGRNSSKGFARGIDFKINGEFVPGAESWMTLSLLRTREDIHGDSIPVFDGEQYVTKEAGYFPRPTDQLFTAGLFFQDYLPNNPDYKVHLSAFYGTGLPLSLPNEKQYYTDIRMRPYRRVDIGFSKVLKREYDQLSGKNPLRYFKSIWLSAEIFNLLGIKNEASYLWIRTISDQQGIPGQFGVPNYLTGRRFNIRLMARF
ncbi:MAG: carboxypeptidase-like regulatory domain-containing protein [Bacteroidales bacterium]|nr:carboxypeptidase-like regulatory domain-containing protein [Bacteroidales bacterium]